MYIYILKHFSYVAIIRTVQEIEYSNIFGFLAGGRRLGKIQCNCQTPNLFNLKICWECYCKYIMQNCFSYFPSI